MKKYTAYKTVQLVLFLALAAVSAFRIFGSPEIFHQVAIDGTMKLLCVLLWAVLGLAFLFIYLDFTFFFGYRKEYREMEYAAQSDPVSGIANRFSCDMMIERYLDKEVPNEVGCIMFDLCNIQEINRLYGHLRGNEAIRDFSGILRLSSDQLCFVGRNGGNKFLAIFENGGEENMKLFLERVEQRVTLHNHDLQSAGIQYRYGTSLAAEDGNESITALIALANNRIGK